jgi:hypothetical protein
MARFTKWLVALAAVGAIVLIPTTKASANVCKPFYKDYSYGFGLPTAHINVGLCTNGSTVWKVWGPDCSISYPGYISHATWCDVYANHQKYVQPGMNWDMNPYFAPWWRYECGWVRFTAWPAKGTIQINGGTGNLNFFYNGC